MQVTTKGAGLNPNAKVWQAIPAHQNDIPEETEDSPWPLTYPPPAEMTDGMSLFSLACRKCFLTSVYLTTPKFIVNADKTAVSSALVQH